jgi:hypothetical protein
VLAGLLTGGCASHGERVRSARELFYDGQVRAAAEQLQEQWKPGDADADVIALDLAVTQILSGRPEEAETTLREVRDRFEHLEQKNLAEAAFSYVTDDNRRAYAGEDYEKVLIRVMLAMCSLMTDGVDAEAYALQVTSKQEEIIQSGVGEDQENPKLAYRPVAAGAYLYGILREESHGNYDDAERSFAKVVSWQPDFQLGHQDLTRARNGRHSAPGNGVLYVFAFVGRGPYKRQVSEQPTSTALLLADRILSATGKHTLPPTVAPIRVAQVVTSANEIDGVLVSVDDQPRGTTETITDVGQLAVQQHQAIYPHVVARAVARRAVKKALIYAAKEQMGGYNGWTNLALDAAGVIWEARETADTRCWALLPDEIQVLRLELPAGEHHVALRPTAGPVPKSGPSNARVTIEDGRNTYLLACYPGRRRAGEILVSGR